MPSLFLRDLDAAVNERVAAATDKYNSGGRVTADEILAKEVLASLRSQTKVFLPGSSTARLMSGISFYETVFAPVCYQCDVLGPTDSRLPLLQSGPVIPVLLNNYSDYPETVVREVIKFPHISRKEFEFYRALEVVEKAGAALCDHCARKRFDAIQRLPAAKDPEVLAGVERFFSQLHPFVEPDFELLDQLVFAIKNQDFAGVIQLMQLASTLQSLRTAQAFDAAAVIPFAGLSPTPVTSSDLNGSRSRRWTL